MNHIQYFLFEILLTIFFYCQLYINGFNPIIFCNYDHRIIQLRLKHDHKYWENGNAFDILLSILKV